MPRTANVQHAHCNEGKCPEQSKRNMPIGIKAKMPTTANVRRVHCKGGNALNIQHATCHANMHTTPTISHHRLAWLCCVHHYQILGHVVSVVLFFNKMSLNIISRNQRNKKCVVAHARCVSLATPKSVPNFSIPCPRTTCPY